MKDIKEILNLMDTLSKDQLAITSEEEQELKALLNTVSVQQTNDCCPTIAPTIAPCNTLNCTPQVACFDFVIPGGLTFPNSSAVDALNCVRGVFVNPTCSSLSPATECLATVGNCQIPVFVASLSGCVQVIANIPVVDASGNSGFLCVSNCICFNNIQVVCTSAPGIGNIKFILQPVSLIPISTDTGCNNDEVWQLNANIVAICRP